MLLNPEKYPQGIMSMFFNAISASENQKRSLDTKVKDNLR